MKKKFIDRWWVRVVVLFVLPSLLSGGSPAVSGFIFLALLMLMLLRSSRNRKVSKNPVKESAADFSDNKAAMPPEGTYILVQSSGNFLVSLAGESHYFDAISRATNRRTGEHAMLAEIIREPDNKFDSNAVRVEISGRTVGYIPREDAPSFHGLLNYGKSINKRVFASCRVWISDEEESYGSVSLDIDDPNSALPPINIAEVPSSAIIWPMGNILQVTEESKNLENVKVIFEKLRDAHSPTVLFELAVDTAKPEKPEIHVLFNGLKVGELSPASGKKFLSAAEKLSVLGKKLFVKGEVTGNSLAVEIRISAKSPELLSEGEIQELLG